MKIAMVVVSVFLLGCARPWTRPNTTDEQVQRDVNQCERDMKEVGGQSFYFERCMLSKGYTEE